MVSGKNRISIQQCIHGQHQGSDGSILRLDEGIGIFDNNRTSNIQTANSDVARSKDSRLLELVNSKTTGIPNGVKR